MNQYKSNKIILFDAYCNLCSRLVQFVLKYDQRHKFRFASLQGEFGQQFLKKNNCSSNLAGTFIFIDGEKYYTRSTGALMLVKNLSGLWPSLYIFILVPKFIRDAIYSWVAKNRYTWFGKRETCLVPDQISANLFLD